MSIGPVERFSRVRGLLQVARENERVLMSESEFAARDLPATKCRKTEIALIDELNALDVSGAFDEISKFLEVTYGGGS